MAAASSSPSAGGRPGRSRRLPGTRSTSPLGRARLLARAAATNWSASPESSLPRAGPGERKAAGAGARSAAPMAGGSGLDHPAGIRALVHDQRLHESDPVSPDSSSINSPRLRVGWAVLSSWARSVWRAEAAGCLCDLPGPRVPPTAPGATSLPEIWRYPVRPRNRTRPARCVRAANFRYVHWRDRQSVPIFVGVETIEHKTQAVFDRYLHRGARGPEGSHRPYDHA